jgi:F-type H+-transporting ATPase subunit alpha
MDFNKMMIENGEFGVVQTVRHPIVVANGLPGARLSEMVLFESGEIGEVFLMEKEEVEILVFSKNAVKAGTKIIRLDKFIAVPVGEELLGNMIDPLGNPISQESPPLVLSKAREIDVPPLGLSQRHHCVNY